MLWHDANQHNLNGPGVEKEAEIKTRTRHAIRELIALCPDDNEGRSAAFLDMREAIHQEIAAALEPTLNKHLHSIDSSHAEAKRRLCTETNRQLRNLGLAIRDHRTGRPAILVADARTASDDKGRFRLELRDETGRIIRTLSSPTLPDHLELMEDSIREEPLARDARSRRGRPPTR
jgi:hypothetical protein